MPPLPQSKVGGERVVIVELFSGLCPASILAARFEYVVEATYYVEIDPDACLCTSRNLPEAVGLGDITKVTDMQIEQIATRHSGAWFLGTAGPPCVDVSILNIDGDGG